MNRKIISGVAIIITIIFCLKESSLPALSQELLISENAESQISQIPDRTSSFKLVVKDITRYIYDLSAYALNINGRILSSQIATEKDYTYAYLNLKVPVDYFDNVNIKAKSQAEKVFYENISAPIQDTQYENLKRRIESLNDELSIKASDKYEKEEEINSLENEEEKEKTQKEIEELEDKITSISNEIETLDIRLQSLAPYMKFATITIIASDKEKYFQSGATNRDFYTGITDIFNIFSFSATTTVILGLIFTITLIKTWSTNTNKKHLRGK